MSSGARYEYHDLKPAAGSFLDDVVAGLSAPRKALPPKYFYDARGSRLFDAICELPEYYPTRTELAMLEASAPRHRVAHRPARGDRRVRQRVGAQDRGAAARGAAARLRRDRHLRASSCARRSSGLAAAFPEVRMVALCADYTRTLPHLAKLEAIDAERRVVYFPGSTIGNFTVPEALAFLRNARAVAGARRRACSSAST